MAEQRPQILAQIVDLSKYESLHKRADDHRKNNEIQAKSLGTQLEAIESVNEAELEALAQQIIVATTAREELQHQLEELIALKVHGQTWNRMVDEQKRLRREIDEAESLLAQGPKIESEANRAAELRRIVPVFRTLAQEKQRLSEIERRIEQLQSDVLENEQAYAQATVVLSEAQEKVRQLQQQRAQLQEDHELKQEELSRLAPQLADINQIAATRVRVEELNDALSVYPPDLDAQILQLERELEVRGEIRQALPSLQHYADARQQWLAAQTQQESSSAKLSHLQEDWDDVSKEQSAASQALAEAQAPLKIAEQEKAATQAHYQQAKDQLSRFEKLDGQTNCNWCGQQLTPRHLASERNRLDGELSLAEGAWEKAAESHQQMVAQEQECQRVAQQIAQRVKILEREITQAQFSLQRAQQSSAEAEQRIKTSLTALPARFRDKLVFSDAQDVLQNVATEFPTEADLSDLQAQAGTVQELTAQLKSWQAQQTKRQRYNYQLEAELPRLHALTQKYSNEQERNIRGAHQAATLAISQLKRELVDCVHVLTDAQLTVDQTRKEADQAADQKHRAEQQVVAETTRQQETARIIADRIEELEVGWRVVAESLALDEIQRLETELQLLANAEDNLKQLQLAREQQEARQTRYAQIEADIAAIDPRAQRPLEELMREEAGTREQLRQADTQRQQAEAEQRTLEERRERRRSLEEQRLAAVRRAELFKQLAILLGRDWLQRELLLNAEKNIVHNANQVLDRISSGTLRLELTNDEEAVSGTGRSGTKALDLVAYHNSTGSDPLPVEFLSTSQRFRVSVSLALGIGQYAGQGERQIESVIIDEGFGSLDKNGLNEMITELHQLKEVLSRIILVSHQVEVADAFPNNKYLVELVEGTSRVSLMEDSA